MNKEIKFLETPKHCPICGGATEIKQDNDSKVLVCINDNCKGKLLGKLTHFVSKNAINIDGLSEQTLKKFIELGWLNGFESVYSLKDHYDKMINLEGFGEKSVKNLLDSIEKSRNTTLDKFIYSLSIPLIGRSASKTIAKYFDYDFGIFYQALNNTFDWTELDDFGDAMSDSIIKYAKDNDIPIWSLSTYFTFEKSQTTSNKNSLSGKTFVITGSLEHFANRDEAKEKIESAGGKVSGSVSAKTDYLVNNDINSTSGKNQKAKSLGVKIIDETELLKMLNT